MISIRGLTALSLLALALTTQAGAQVPVSPADSLKSMSDIAKTTLLYSDALAAREMRYGVQRDIELAEFGVTKGSTGEIRQYASQMVKEHNDHLAQLDQILRKLKAGPGVDRASLGLGAGMEGRDPVVAVYYEETQPVFIRDSTGNYVRDTTKTYRRDNTQGAGAAAGRRYRDSTGAFVRDTTVFFRRNDDGTYSPDPVAIFRWGTVAALPMTESMQALLADSAEVIARHAAARDTLRALSGKAFDSTFVDASIMKSDRERARLRDRIIPMLLNAELKKLAEKREALLGTQERNAKDLKQKL
jgi:predicted outer membrane protein